ncbi:DUF3631 domain-containing protein [Streptomyces roseifaciens]|uniref:DUF3631 domain-containing protein n=1 Tax=Streptomyces roseifaciens TaxID=1488406 RepID=UPI0009A0463A|nr:DUF3631 domain-containing protein [Streptomyces roseifaciens]
MTPFLAELLIGTPCCAQHRPGGASMRLPYPALTPAIHTDEALQEEHRARCRQTAAELLERTEELVHLLNATPRRSAAPREVAAHPSAGRRTPDAVKYSQGDTGILRTCREVFAAHADPGTLPTADLVEALRSTKGSAWGAWQREDLTPRRLAMLLSPYSIRSHNIRLPDGTQRKGYRRSEFTAALHRHRPDLPVSPARHDGRAV